MQHDLAPDPAALEKRFEQFMAATLGADHGVLHLQEHLQRKPFGVERVAGPHEECGQPLADIADCYSDWPVAPRTLLG